MSIFKQVFQGIAYEELMWRTVYPEVEDRTASGIFVHERNATSIADFFKCVHVISEDIAKLPKKVMRQAMIAGRESRETAATHPLYYLLKAEPNPMMSAFRFFETGVIHLLTWGSWYSYIQRGERSGRVQALWPICPHLVRVEKRRPEDPAFIPFWYMIQNAVSGVEERFFPDEILHVPYFSYDGITGQSPVRLQMDTLGLAKATERYGARFFGNGARLSGILGPADGAGVLTTEQVDNLRKSFEAKHRGVDNSGRIAVIDGATKFQPLTMPNDEAQFLESRKFNRIDIAGMLRMAPHKISDLENAHFTNIEHSNISHVQDCLQPLVERIEQEFERALLSRDDKGRVFVNVVLDGMLRGDTAARTAYYRERFNTSSITPNQIREKEDETPLEFEGADEPWIQLNMVPLSIAKQLLTEPQPQSTPDSNRDNNRRQEMEMEEEMGNRLLVELRARFQAAYSHVFRDAVGRVLSRRAPDRERSAPGIFERILLGLTDGLNLDLDAEFLREYLAAMGKRAIEWKDIDTVAVQELDRAVKAILENGKARQPALAEQGGVTVL